MMRNKLFHMIFLFAYVLIVCKAMIACYRITGFNYLHMALLFVSGLLLYRFAPKKKLSIVLVLSALLLLILFSLDNIKPLWENYIIQNYNAINNGIYYASELEYSLFLPFLVVLIPATAAVCYALSVRGAALFSILIISIYMFSFWNNGLDILLVPYLPYYLFPSILYYCVAMYDKLAVKLGISDTKVKIKLGNIFVYALFLSAAIAVFTTAAAHFLGVKSIIQLRNDYASTEASLLFNSKNSVFGIADAGFGSDTGKLGGPVQIDDLIVLKVKAERPSYLRGSIKDYYDGRSWKRSLENYISKGREALLKANESFNLLMTGDADKKPYSERMSIHNYNLSTSTLFAPGNTFNISTKVGKIMYDNAGVFMLLGKGTLSETYNLRYYKSSTDVESFREAYASGLNIEYGTDLKPYEKYLQLPETITPRTYNLVNEITKNCKTAGDKAAQIMNFLSEGYPYSLDVSHVPEDTDFIDYFLFSEKKGYCTYFATAATIMCRIAGIPARYVEGFNMNEERDSDGVYIVRNHRAHAWTEILVSPECGLWSVLDCVPEGTPVDEITVSNQYKDKFDDDRYKNGNYRILDGESEESDNERLRYLSSLLSMLLYPVFIIPAAAFLLLILYIIYGMIRFRIKTIKVLKTQSTIPLYLHISARMKAIGEGFPEELCELEYVRSLKDRKLSECLEKLVTACYEEHYGSSSEPSFVDKKACNRVVERYLRKRQGFFKYWYYRIRNT